MVLGCGDIVLAACVGFSNYIKEKKEDERL